MATYTREEIALVLQAAEVLNQKGSSQKINISTFCREVDISRKNAYKHKNNIDTSQSFYQDQLTKLEQDNSQLKEKLKLTESKAQQADLHSDCREFLKQYVKDNKKNPKRREKLIKSYNKLALSHGLEPLDFWE